MAAPTIGNADYRGYLNYLSQQGDGRAAALLGFAGNDGQLDPNKSAAYTEQYFNGPGAVSTTTGGQLFGGGANQVGLYNNQLYSQFNALNNAPAGGASDPAQDPAVYDQAIANTQAQYDRQGNLLTSGLQGVDTSYQNALNQLLLGKNQADQSYGENKQTSATDYVKAKNTVGVQAGQALNGLRRLLGSRGISGTPFDISAPQAVGDIASQQRGDASDTFSQNQRALDQSYGTFNLDYNNQLNSAASQRDTQKKSINDSISSNRASLLQSLAQLNAQKSQAAGGNGVAQSQPYLDQANTILNGLSNYTAAPINYQTQAYQAPSLASYAQAPQAAAQARQGGASDYFSPYLSSLLGKKQQLA